MVEIVWHYDPRNPVADSPRDAAEAQQRLADGNRAFAGLAGQEPHSETKERVVIPIAGRDLGLAAAPGAAPAQEPFAAILGCADARVPVELIFGLHANQAFVVRVAGNVLSNETLGSLEYAVVHMPTVRLLVVLGHTGCGAVSAAVDAYLNPETYLSVAPSVPLRTIVDSLVIPVRAAAEALAVVHGAGVAGHGAYRTAVIEVAVALNAALVARSTAGALASAPGADRQVVFGVYDLRRRRVGLPDLDAAEETWRSGLFTPPADETGFRELGRGLAASTYIRGILA